MNKVALFTVVVLIGLAGCEKIEDLLETEQQVDLVNVPQVVLEAAREAVAGIVLSEAEMETEDGVTVYELEGTANGIEYEIEVRADGTVLEIEQEENEDDAGDDDDD